MYPELQVEAASRRSRLKRVAWLIGLVLAFEAVYLGSGVLARGVHMPALGATALVEAIILVVALAFTFADGDGVEVLGLKGAWKGSDAAVIFGLIALQLAGSIVTLLFLMGAGRTNSMTNGAAFGLLNSFGRYSTFSFFLIALGLAALAGITEEILFRGYLITRLQGLGLGKWSCILLSALVFGMVHWPGYGFVSALSKGIWFGIPTGWFFWRRRSLGPLITAHALMDFLGFMAAHLGSKFMSPG